jgi:hypothetical protein
MQSTSPDAPAGAATHPVHPSRADWRYALGVVLLTRALFLGLGYLAYAFWLPGTGMPRGLALGIWRNWDANILLGIASHGYTPAADPHATAFFPVFPLLVRGLTRTGIPVIAAGLLVNAAACTVAFAYLSHLARRDLGSAEAGRHAVLYLAFFPTAVFLVAPYTEAVFLAGAIAAFSYARSGHWWWAALPAAISAGTRLIGLLLLAGLVVELLRQRPPRRTAAAAAALAIGAVPFLLYAAFLWKARGDPLYFLTDHRIGWGRSFTGPVESLRATLDGPRWAPYGSGFLLAMRFEVVAAIAGVGFTLWAVVRREWGYATFMGLGLAAVMTSTWYLSIPRVLLSMFPIPILLSSFTNDRPNRHDALLASSAAIAAFGVVAFARRAWFF